jgi:two-component system response regulator FixJ
MSNEPTVFIVDDDNEVREAIGLLMDSVGCRETFDSAWAYLNCFDPSGPAAWCSTCACAT